MTTLIIAMGVLLVLLLIGCPIAFAFFGSTLAIALIEGYDSLFLLPYAYTKVNTLILLAIPLFVLAGSLMEKGGIGAALVDFISLFVGKIKGGLGIVMTCSCAAFGAISGSGFATLSCIGSILLPRMRELGYPRGHSAALISSSAVLGLFIPPSVNMILIAFLTQASMLSCFMSTVIPGLILMTLLSVTNCFLLRKNTEIQLPQRPRGTKREKISFFKVKTVGAVPAMLCPAIILGGIYCGLFTPTEAAAVAVLYSIPVGLCIYKGLDRRKICEAVIRGATTTGVIFIMLFSVMMLSRIYIMENVPQMILEALSAISDNRIILLLMINLFVILVGMLMDDGSALLLVTPILMPLMQSLDIGMVHFAAIVATNVGMGTVTPPCAPFLYFGARVGDAQVGDMLKPTMWFLLCAWLPTLLLVTYVPAVSEWLPGILGLPV